MPQVRNALLGRDAELEMLRVALADAVRGRSQFVLITGEAGIGKTRLLEELAPVGAARPSASRSPGALPSSRPTCRSAS